MPKRRPPRSQRRRSQRPPAPPLVAPAAPRPAPRPLAIATETPERAREPSATRFTVRDYSYVRRELLRIVALAAVIIIVIFILSFFLP